MQSLGFISMPGGGEWIVIGFIGLMLFGKRLPEVARSLGQSVTEFKKGLSSFESEMHRGISEASTDTSAAKSIETQPPSLAPTPGSAQPIEESNPAEHNDAVHTPIAPCLNEN